MVYFTVGPSQLHHSVPKSFAKILEQSFGSLGHRTSGFQKLFTETTDNLRNLLKIPTSHNIFFVSSGTESMERVIENTVEKTSLHFVNGSFSDKFYKTALELRKDSGKIEVPYGQSFEWKNIEIKKDVELLCFTHNETSTGVMLPVSEIYKLKSQNPDKLIAVDTVSSMPYVDIDYNKVDMVFFSIQKGFGLPAGLGIMIVSPQAIGKASNLESKGISTGSYHSFASLKKYADKAQTPETPNVIGIFLLNEVLKNMLEIGIGNIRSQIEKNYEIMSNFIEKSDTLSYLPSDKNIRSKTIHVVKVEGGSEALTSKLKSQGIAISSGYGKMKADYVRIANFPNHSEEMVKGLISKMGIYDL